MMDLLKFVPNLSAVLREGRRESAAETLNERFQILPWRQSFSPSELEQTYFEDFLSDIAICQANHGTFAAWRDGRSTQCCVNPYHPK